MNSDEMNELLSRRNNAIVGVNRESGCPHMTPVWYVWDGETFRFSTTNYRAKYFHIKRNPSITLIVDDPKVGYVVAYGQADVLEQNVAELSRPIIEKYMADRVEQGMAMMRSPNRVLVMLRPQKILTN